LAKRALDRELNATSTARQDLPVKVNDLTSMVVKKKKKAPAPEASAAEKRKAEDAEAQPPQDKKARLEESSSAP
jgi:HAT1-interacting factor 1